MTKQGWIAIMLAITLPSTALMVVLLTRNGGPHRHHRERRHRSFTHERAGRREPGGRHHGVGRNHGISPRMKHFRGKGHTRFGRNPGWHRGEQSHPRGSLMRGLGLSEDQRTKMMALRTAARTKKEALVPRVEALEKELSTLLETDTPDQGAVEAKLAEISALRLKARTIRVLTRIEIQKLLTGEQKKRFSQRRNETQRGHGGMFRRGHHFGLHGRPGVGPRGGGGAMHYPGSKRHHRGGHHGRPNRGAPFAGPFSSANTSTPQAPDMRPPPAPVQ